MENENEKLDTLRAEIKENIETLKKGQKALDDAIELLKILDKIN